MMAIKRQSSKQTAANFLKLRKDEWSYVERFAPGCGALWRLEVDLPTRDFTMGVTGKPLTVVAIEKNCSSAGQHRRNCECRVFHRDSKMWVREVLERGKT